MLRRMRVLGRYSCAPFSFPNFSITASARVLVNATGVTCGCVGRRGEEWSWSWGRGMRRGEQRCVSWGRRTRYAGQWRGDIAGPLRLGTGCNLIPLADTRVDANVAFVLLDIADMPNTPIAGLSSLPPAAHLSSTLLGVGLGISLRLGLGVGLAVELGVGLGLGLGWRAFSGLRW